MTLRSTTATAFLVVAMAAGLISFGRPSCLLPLYPSPLPGASPGILFQDSPIIPAVTQPGLDRPMTASPRAASAVAPGEGPSDPAELDAFLKPLFATAMKDLHIPGAVFILVKDGRVFYKAGYGCGNVEKKTTVNPDRTLFRVGSISKLFVATAAMQLSENGQLDLKADVNHYLKSFRLKKTYDRPVTMTSLLTHTGGFDEQIIGMAARTEAERVPLPEYLNRRMPEQAVPPGEVISYSNHGSALAGCVIQDVSGEPFSEYVDRHVFAPLQMERSSFILSPRLAPDLATGYEYDPRSGQNQQIPLDYLNIAPAGGLFTTAGDLAHFMIANLQGGRYRDSRILKEATVREMHRQQFTNHPRLPGFAYGFYERRQNGEQAIEHGGLWHGFASELFLLPKRHLGFFVSCNSGQPYMGELIVRSFLDHYFSAQRDGSRQASARSVSRPAAAAGDLSRFAGSYRYNRYDRHTFLKLFGSYNEVDVSADGDRALILGSNGGHLTRWLPVEPMVFRREGSDDLLAFRGDGSGRVTYLFIGMAAFERLAPYETNSFQGRLLIVILLTLLAAAGPWNTAVRRLWSGAPPEEGEAPIWRPDVLAQTMAIANLSLMLLFFLAISRLGFDVVYGVSIDWRVLSASAIVTCIWGTRIVGLVLRSWSESSWTLSPCLYAICAMLGSVGWWFFMAYWNLMMPVV